jgi:arylsulfatase A-like enzyme
MYDSEIRYVDEAVGEILNTLEAEGLADDTVVVLSADHGESLLEHDILFEHHGLYDCTLRVPFVVRWPAGGVSGGQRLTGLRDQRDVLPTLLEAAGKLAPEGVEGQSLLPALRGQGDTGRDQIVAEECTWQVKWALRTRTHKLILAREPDLHNTPMLELYDLEADPGETVNLAGQEKALARRMEQELEAWIALRLKETGQSQDPLVAQGATLGKRYKELFANTKLD